MSNGSRIRHGAELFFVHLFVLSQSRLFSESLLTDGAHVWKDIVMSSLWEKINRLASELLTYFVSIEFRESNECFGAVGMSTFVREFSSVYFEMNVEVRLRAVRFMASWFCTIESLSVRIMCSLMFLSNFINTIYSYSDVESDKVDNI